MFDRIFGDCALIFVGFMEEMRFVKGSLTLQSLLYIAENPYRLFFLTEMCVQHLTGTWKKGPAQLYLKLHFVSR